MSRMTTFPGRPPTGARVQSPPPDFYGSAAARALGFSPAFVGREPYRFIGPNTQVFQQVLAPPDYSGVSVGNQTAGEEQLRPELLSVPFNFSRSSPLTSSSQVRQAVPLESSRLAPDASRVLSPVNSRLTTLAHPRALRSGRLSAPGSRVYAPFSAGEEHNSLSTPSPQNFTSTYAPPVPRLPCAFVHSPPLTPPQTNHLFRSVGPLYRRDPVAGATPPSSIIQSSLVHPPCQPPQAGRIILGGSKTQDRVTGTQSLMTTPSINQLAPRVSLLNNCPVRLRVDPLIVKSSGGKLVEVACLDPQTTLHGTDADALAKGPVGFLPESLPVPCAWVKLPWPRRAAFLRMVPAADNDILPSARPYKTIVRKTIIEEVSHLPTSYAMRYVHSAPVDVFLKSCGTAPLPKMTNQALQIMSARKIFQGVRAAAMGFSSPDRIPANLSAEYSRLRGAISKKNLVEVQTQRFRNCDGGRLIATYVKLGLQCLPFAYYDFEQMWLKEIVPQIRQCLTAKRKSKPRSSGEHNQNQAHMIVVFDFRFTQSAGPSAGDNRDQAWSPHKMRQMVHLIAQTVTVLSSAFPLQMVSGMGSGSCASVKGNHLVDGQRIVSMQILVLPPQSFTEAFDNSRRDAKKKRIRHLKHGGELSSDSHRGSMELMGLERDQQRQLELEEIGDLTDMSTTRDEDDLFSGGSPYAFGRGHNRRDRRRSGVGLSLESSCQRDSVSLTGRAKLAACFASGNRVASPAKRSLFACFNADRQGSSSAVSQSPAEVKLAPLAGVDQTEPRAAVLACLNQPGFHTFPPPPAPFSRSPALEQGREPQREEQRREEQRIGELMKKENAGGETPPRPQPHVPVLNTNFLAATYAPPPPPPMIPGLAPIQEDRPLSMSNERALQEMTEMMRRMEQRMSGLEKQFDAAQMSSAASRKLSGAASTSTTGVGSLGNGSRGLKQTTTTEHSLGEQFTVTDLSMGGSNKRALKADKFGSGSDSPSPKSMSPAKTNEVSHVRASREKNFSEDSRHSKGELSPRSQPLRKRCGSGGGRVFSACVGDMKDFDQLGLPIGVREALSSEMFSPPLCIVGSPSSRERETGSKLKVEVYDGTIGVALESRRADSSPERENIPREVGGGITPPVKEGDSLESNGSLDQWAI